MKSKWIAIACSTVSCALVYAGTVLATPSSGVTTTVYGIGSFDDIHVATTTELSAGAAPEVWQARIETQGATDLQVLENTIAPGGTFGWHKHPGPSLVIVKSGTATLYMGADADCAGVVVPTGSGFIDHGSDIHVVRNETSEELVTVVVSLIPAGVQRRIDMPTPDNCPALPNG